MSRLLRALGATEGTITAWKLFLIFQGVLFIVILVSIVRAIINGSINPGTQEFNIGLIVEMMGTSASFWALFLFWELPRIQAQEKSEQQTQKALEEIKALLVSQQYHPLPPATTPTPVTISSTAPTLSRTTSILISALLSAILIIILRRTHKP